MSNRVIDPRIDGPICEWSDLIQGVRTWAHALGLECDMYRGLGGRPAGVCRSAPNKYCLFDKLAYIRHSRLVECFRAAAATSVDRAAYYREALHLWRNVFWLLDKKFEVAIREAAALDKVELKDADE